jgi:hypothetical protein
MSETGAFIQFSLNLIPILCDEEPDFLIEKWGWRKTAQREERPECGLKTGGAASMAA